MFSNLIIVVITFLCGYGAGYIDRTIRPVPSKLDDLMRKAEAAHKSAAETKAAETPEE